MPYIIGAYPFLEVIAIETKLSGWYGLCVRLSGSDIDLSTFHILSDFFGIRVVELSMDDGPCLSLNLI